MRVLNFISGRNLGGSKQAFLDYSLMCFQQGFEVHSMIRTHSPLKGLLQNMPSGVANNIIELNYFRLTWPIFKQWALMQFKRATRNLTPAVVLVHKPVDLYFMKRTFPRVKVVGVLHSYTAKHLQNADHIFAVSEALKKYVIDSGCKVPVSVINNAISVPAEPKLSHRSTIGVGTMAVFRRTKRLDLLLMAFRELKKKQIPFHGVIAGAGIQKPYLRYLINRWGLDSCVELRPWVHDKESFYQDIDIFCITSKSETFSISLIEAMARKKCVVATACGGPNEIIEDDVDGLLVPVGDVEALTRRLATAIESGALRERLATEAYKKVSDKYSIEIVQRKIAEKLNLMVQ